VCVEMIGDVSSAERFLSHRREYNHTPYLCPLPKIRALPDAPYHSYNGKHTILACLNLDVKSEAQSTTRSTGLLAMDVEYPCLIVAAYTSIGKMGDVFGQIRKATS